MDYNMPKMNGLEVAIELKKILGEQEILMPKVAIITGIEDDRLRNHCIMHVDYFFTKSFKKADLAEIISTLNEQST